jgi:phosphoribosylamine--glycine ligase
VPYLKATARGELETLEAPAWDERTCVGVVAASEGYPGAYEKGDVIDGLEAAARVEEVIVFHAGTRSGLASDGTHQLETAGGRVLCVTALGAGIEEARERAYRAYGAIRWHGKFCRSDIGLERRRRAEEPLEDAVPWTAE